MEEMKLPGGRSLGKILHPKLILLPTTLTHDTETMAGPNNTGQGEDGGALANPILQEILETVPFSPTLRTYWSHRVSRVQWPDAGLARRF